MPWLTFMIEVPTFIVISWLFLRGRPPRYGWPVVMGSLVLAFVATTWGYRTADPSHGRMWPEVFAALAGYGAFLAALFIGWLVPWLGARR